MLAADGRGVADKTGTPDDSFCKIAAFRHQFIFVSVGSARYAKTDINHPVKSWDNAEVAGEAIRNMCWPSRIGGATLSISVASAPSGWIFKALGVYRPISLIGAREQTAARSSIGSMNPATLSLGMVASLQCPLPFHMAELL